MKSKIAIFDLTDCEGCELGFIALKKKLLELLKEVEIVNWRLADENRYNGPFDIAFVEGAPMTDEERKALQDIRENSKILIALGSCACLGGVQGSIDQNDRKSITERIYGRDYVPLATDAKPLDAYVKVDFHIHGCPIDTNELERFITSLLFGKIPESRRYPVCFDCKERGNSCFLINGEPCLGPITRGGCGAICVSNKKPCVGCYGIIRGANVRSMKSILNKILGKEDTENLLHMFLNYKIKELKE